MRRSRGQFRVGGDRRARGRLALAVVSLGLAGWLLRSEASGGEAGFPFAALVLLGVALAATRVRKVNPRVARLLGLVNWRRTSALAIAAALITWIWREHPQRSFSVAHTDLVIAWLLALAFYWLAVVPAAGHRMRGHGPTRWRGARGLIPLLLATLMLGALALRLWHLGTVPYVLSGDEALFGAIARQIIAGTVQDPFGIGIHGMPTMSWYLGGIGMRLFSPEIAALRLPWALVGTLTVLTTFWLVSLLHGPRLALMTSALLATYHFHIHYSRLALNNVADPLLVSLVLIFFHRALRGQRAADWLGVGACGGLALYFYTGARLAPLLIAALLGYSALHAWRTFFRRHGSGLLIALGAFAITAAPMLQVALRSPRDFFARTDATSIFQSGWLVAEAQARGQSPVRVFAEYASHALLAFNLYPDLSEFYALPQPLLDPVFGVLFLFGLGYATMRALGRGPHRRFVPLVAWWWSGIFFGGVLTIGAPSSQRLITLAVPTCFFIALALQRLGRLLRAAVSGIPLNAVLAVAVLLFGVMSIKTYFVDFSPLRLYGGEHAQIATITAPLAAALGPQYDAYLAGAPDIFWGLPTFGFLAPDIDGHDLIAPLTAATVPVMTPGRGGIFIFTASRQGEVATIRAAYPGGVESTFHVATDGRVLAVTYVVPATR